MSAVTTQVATASTDSLAQQLQRALRCNPARRTVWLDRPANLYREHDQAEAYLRASTQQSYVQRFGDPIASLLHLHAPDLLAGCGASTFIDLGPGTLCNSLPLLDALDPAIVPYAPVDISTTLLREASERAAGFGFRGPRLHCLFEQVPDRLPALTDPARPRLVNIGPTFMNYRPAECVRLLDRLLREGDTAIAAALLQTSPSKATAPYRNAAAEQFTFLPLRALGVPREQADYAVQFARSRVEMGFVLQRRHASGHGVLDAGTRLVTALSYRHTATSFASWLSRLGAVDMFVSEEGGAAVARVTRRRSGQRI